MPHQWKTVKLHSIPALLTEASRRKISMMVDEAILPLPSNWWAMPTPRDSFRTIEIIGEGCASLSAVVEGGAMPMTDGEAVARPLSVEGSSSSEGPGPIELLYADLFDELRRFV